jgi:uncharacterized membrane protein
VNFKSKALWLNVIAIILLVLQYSISNFSKGWVVYEGLAVVVLNAIAGMIQSSTVTKLKKENTAYKNRMNQPK